MYLKINIRINNFKKPKKVFSIIHTSHKSSDALEVPLVYLQDKIWRTLLDEFYDNNIQRISDLYDFYLEHLKNVLSSDIDITKSERFKAERRKLRREAYEYLIDGMAEVFI